MLAVGDRVSALPPFLLGGDVCMGTEQGVALDAQNLCDCICKYKIGDHVTLLCDIGTYPVGSIFTVCSVYLSNEHVQSIPRVLWQDVDDWEFEDGIFTLGLASGDGRIELLRCNERFVEKGVVYKREAAQIYETKDSCRKYRDFFLFSSLFQISVALFIVLAIVFAYAWGILHTISVFPCALWFPVHYGVSAWLYIRKERLKEVQCMLGQSVVTVKAEYSRQDYVIVTRGGESSEDG